MKLKNSQSLFAIVLSILAHAIVAVLGDYQSGKSGNEVGPLSVKVVSHSSNSTTQNSSSPQTEQASEPESISAADPVKTTETEPTAEPATKPAKTTETVSEAPVVDKVLEHDTAEATAVHEEVAAFTTASTGKAKSKDAASTSDELADNQVSAEGVASVEGLVTANIPLISAMPLYHLIPKPPYPSRSRDLGEEGTVIIAIKVSAEGGVAVAYVSKSSGHALLDGSALASIRSQWQFKPATRAGHPVESWVRVPITFNIKNR